ncbi:DUF5305 domain-containing protein [Clostridium sp. D2Q-11]|uniref:DUF5305 domain-containing protein n=1 Tax=Anaeromonas frigoriresistens TaxID=2683708 RepID=A0A942UXC8_9FIRM|nr:DUF5305 family protein [Anaeromonas frigoriresistens]MBS4538549.1 DUF5305 domain-containing protein [Anaeromonas frigoriresistens]
MNKKHINKKLRLGLIATSIIILAIISFLLIKGLTNSKIKEESVSLYDYTINPQANYEVKLKNNMLFQQRTIEEGQTYFAEFLDTIDTTFNYEFIGEKEAELKGDYQIVAVAEGYSKENEEIQTLWKKEFPIGNKEIFSKKADTLSINKNIKFNLTEYNNFAKSVSEAAKTSSYSRVSVMMKVNLEATTAEGVIKETASPSIVIPLEESSFIIAKVGVEEKKNSIEETRKVEVPLAKSFIIIYSIIIAMSLLLLIYLIVFTKNVVEVDLHEKYLDKIFKNHGTRLVALEKNTDSTYENYYKVRSIDDLVRVADEIEKPIMYRYSSDFQNIKEFYVVDDRSLYTFDLENYINNLEKDIKKKKLKPEIV